MAEQVLDHGGAERRVAGRVVAGVGGRSPAARQARRQAARSSTSVHGAPGRRSTTDAAGTATGPAGAAAGTVAPTTKVPTPRRPATQPSASSWS